MVSPKTGTIFVHRNFIKVNINRFLKLFHCQTQEKTCNYTVTKDPSTLLDPMAGMSPLPGGR